ncbi:unnamed protein product [Rotaria sordida]|uniref:Uncharacterized protein n=1 Tax=Rotaria sordida TaxID=392033 RepID=A0A814U2A6_9BILA|nr:unnamed protein product [Rotaria sordida]CAF1314474.1 unnamed protein product [Rotaria sordida]CAF1530105.1 unnamed protein product [Rotaria sordida]CAF3642551.1 unnamed protein product [Rotaria sordida]
MMDIIMFHQHHYHFIIFNSSGVSVQNYGGENYNNVPQQSSSRSGGPMHERRGGGGGTYGNRSVPYSSRGDCHVCSDRGRGEQSIFYINC